MEGMESRESQGSNAPGSNPLDYSGGLSVGTRQLGQGTIFLLLRMRMKSGDAHMRGGRSRIFGKIFVTFEPDRDSDLGLGAAGSAAFLGRGYRGRRRRANYAQNVSAAAHRHVLSECNFGRHAEGQFDFSAHLQRRIGEEKYSARTEVLGKSEAFGAAVNLPERNREQVREALPNTTFHPNWSSSHIAETWNADVLEIASKSTRYCSS